MLCSEVGHDRVDAALSEEHSLDLDAKMVPALADLHVHRLTCVRGCMAPSATTAVDDRGSALREGTCAMGGGVHKGAHLQTDVHQPAFRYGGRGKDERSYTETRRTSTSKATEELAHAKMR